jgi:hypothetical protein
MVIFSYFLCLFNSKIIDLFKETIDVALSKAYNILCLLSSNFIYLLISVPDINIIYGILFNLLIIILVL